MMNSQQGSSNASCMPGKNASLEYPMTTTSSAPDAQRFSEENHDDEKSLSAPIELLSEFLSALMLRDYETALLHCNTILQYEPDNETALEFSPLIQQRLSEAHIDDSSSDEDMRSSCSEESWGTSTTSSDEYSTADNSLWTVSTMTNSESFEKNEESDELDTSVEEDEHQI